MSKNQKVLVIVSDDKIGKFFLAKAPQHERILYCYDHSSSFRRVFKMLRRGSLSLALLFKMFYAEFFRYQTKLRWQPKFGIRNNSDLQQILAKEKIGTVFLFRAGLIISNKTLSLPCEFLNVHCAKLPEYGGIGVLQRALSDKNWHQEATMHKVVQSIDGGEVLCVEPYELDPKLSYGENEDKAYRAGAVLLDRVLRSRYT